jgi:endonuclease/exonuclease/phosphatase family metal-dependent hydrolase
MRLVAATYNVQSFRAGVERAVEALAPEPPDLVLIQESGPRRTLKRFAAAMGMEFVSSHRLFTRVQNAVLFRAPWRVSGVEVQDLPPQGRTHPRGFVVARLRAQGIKLTAVAAHLGLVPIERFHHARLLADHVAGVDGPLIIGVDVNEGPEGPTTRWLAERLFDAGAQPGGDARPTLPAWDPTVRIDFMFVNEAAPVIRSWVPSSPAVSGASDHRPVLAEVDLSAGGGL